ncbi:hypothetical protein CONCODRAFT_69096 [Conidiobolus coronatus NRRL 28638]|uniref:Uncharacterized protein n=1 Tax=Conidiobolus coronatus (strain ATCC 28846 / CBS 209.66 / NRRL 28638) TaxID=796925 RepID=A0A137PBJ1_CONC2|nr:hypothetical protein CONCODRAFT_69096 [Conidiobolus coronatus NRRL 28638]|eukprot:KXN72312.1 hypothetical protein CONCODRAFT_69096 [Conidiobolus coronatus NRRL 28638]
MNTNTPSTPNKLNIPILKFPLATSSPTKQKLNIMSEPVLAQFIQKHRTIVHHHFNSDLDTGLKAHNLLKSMVDPKTKKTYDDDNDSLVSLRSKLGVDDDEGISIIDMSSPESSERLRSRPSSLKSSNSTLSVKELEFTDKVENGSVTEDLDSSQHSSETLTVLDLHAKEDPTISANEFEFTDKLSNDSISEDLVSSQHSDETLTVSDDLHTKEDNSDELNNSSKTEDLDSSQNSSKVLTVSDLHAKDNYTKTDSTKQNLEISSNILNTSPDKFSSGLELDFNPIPEALNFNQSKLNEFKPSSNSEESVNNINLQDSPHFYDNYDDEVKTRQIGTNLDLINGESNSNVDKLNLTDIELIAGEIKNKEKKSKSETICSQLDIQTPIINLEDTLDSPDFEAYESFNDRVDRDNNNLQITDNITQDQFNNNSLHLNFHENEVNAETETELKEVEATQAKNELNIEEEDKSVENESDIDDFNDTTVTSITLPTLFDSEGEDVKLGKLTQLNTSSSSTTSLQSLPASSETFNTDMNSIYSRLLTKTPSLNRSSTYSLTSDTQPETLYDDTDIDLTQIDTLDVSELKHLVLELVKSNERINTWYRGVSHHIPNSARIAYNKLKSTQSEKLMMLKNLVNNNSYGYANSDYEYFNRGSSSLSLQSCNTLSNSNSKSFLKKEVNINEFVENYRDHGTRVELARYLARAGRY